MDNCKSLAELAVELWKKFAKLAPPKVIVGEAILAEAIEGFDQLIKEPKYQIGPRLLPVGQKQSGKIRSIGDRKFIMAYPTTRPSKLAITKDDGKDHVTVHVCAFGPDDTHVELKTFEITKDTPNGHTVVVDIPEQRIVSVLFDGHRLLDSMSYHLELTQR